MNPLQRNRAGLSLLEVLLAVVIMSVGVLAASALQASAVLGTAKAENMQTVTSLAESEVFFRRQIRPTSGNGLACEGGSLEDYTCNVTVTPCSINGAAFTCNNNVTDPAAYQIAVTVVGPRNDSTTINSVVAVNETYAEPE